VQVFRYQVLLATVAIAAAMIGVAPARAEYVTIRAIAGTSDGSSLAPSGALLATEQEPSAGADSWSGPDSGSPAHAV